MPEGGFCVVAVKNKFAYKTYKNDDHCLSRGMVIELSVMQQIMGHANVLSVMSVIDGPPLQVLMPAFDSDLAHLTEPLCASALYSTARQLTEGLAHLHTHSFIHRDVKPMNGLIRRPRSKKPHVVLCDFNSCAFVIPGRTMTAMPTTVSYAAPELLLESQTYSYEIDAWSLGITIVEIALGERWLKTNSQSETISAFRQHFGLPAQHELPHVAPFEQTPQKVLSLEVFSNKKLEAMVRQLLEVAPHRRLTVVDATRNFFRRKISCFEVQHRRRELFRAPLNENMRTILLDWLADVSVAYKLSLLTYQHAMSMTDMYVATHEIERGQLQLVGCVAMFLAATALELEIPLPSDFVHISDGAFSISEFDQMALHAFKALGYNALHPIPFDTLKECAASFDRSNAIKYKRSFKPLIM